MIGRIRTFKPELLTHPLLRKIERALGWNLRLWYLGLFAFTDREGRFEWKPEELKHYIEPDADVDFARVLDVLANAGFIVKYRAGARLYGWIPRFLDHQQINGREHASSLPAPPRVAAAFVEHSCLRANFQLDEARELLREAVILVDGVSLDRFIDLQHRREPSDASTQSPDASTTLSQSPHRTEQNRTEQNKEEPTSSEALDGVVCDGAAAPGTELVSTRGPLPVVSDDARNVRSLPAIRGPRRAEVVRERIIAVLNEVQSGSRARLKHEQARKLNAEIVFLYWSMRFDHTNAILDPKREGRIVARLKENDDNVSELLYALDGAFHDDLIMARGEYASRKRYDGIETVLRDRGQVERFSTTRKAFLKNEPHKWLGKLEAAVKGDAEPGAVFDGPIPHAEEVRNG